MKPNQLTLTPDDLAKVQRAKARSEGDKISPEWAFVARFGYYFGYEGAKAIMNNEIDFETADLLLRGAEKTHSSDVVDMANAIYVANVASRSKKGAQVLKKGLDSYIKNSRVGA